MSNLPIKIKKRHVYGNLPIRIYLPVHRWIDKTFIDLETQQEVESQIWRFVALVSLNSIYKTGRKYRTKEGHVRKSKKVYGFQAVAEALSDARCFPITESEVEKLVKDAVDRQIAHAKFVLESDLVPTSPDMYQRKNRWLLIANIPSSDEMNSRINAQLKKAGSSLRIKGALKTRLVEA